MLPKSKASPHLLNCGVVGGHGFVLHCSPDLLVLLGHQHLTLGQRGRGGRGGFRHGGGRGGGGRRRLLEDALLDLLLLLECLNKGRLQPVGVLGLQGLLLIGGHALVTENVPGLLLPPAGGKVCLTLGAGVWLFGNSIGHGSSRAQITYVNKTDLLRLDISYILLYKIKISL